MRRPSALLLVAAGLAVGRGVAAQQIPVRLGGTPSSFVGLPFDAPLEVDMSARAEKLGSFAVTIRWNPAVLQFLSGQNGNFGSITGKDDSTDFGLLRLTAANPAGVGGKVVLGVAHFVPLVAATDTIKLNVTELYAAGTFADLLPSAVWSDRTYCPAVGRYGDIDGNGSVTSADALAALTYAVGKSITGNAAVGDVDGDGLTNARDALIILANAVGLDVTGFRLFVPAPGGCAAGERPLLELFPGNLTLDVAQVARYTPVARDSAGATLAATDLLWQSSNPAVASVDTAGVVTALAPGTTTIKVFRTAGAQATATVTVLNRRTHWVDAFASPEDQDQLGAPELPFRTIAQGLAYARSGDTVRVRPARYEEIIQLTRPVTVWGDTTPAGARPRLVPPPNEFAGITILTAGSVAIGHLAIDGFQSGVLRVGTLDTLLLDGVQIFVPTALCGGAAVDVDTLTALIVRRSRLVGDGQQYGCATGVLVSGVAQTVVLDQDQIVNFGYYGVLVSSADSVHVSRSLLSDNFYALRALAGPAGTLALVVDQSRLERNYYSGIDVQDLRSGLVSHSVIDDPYYYDDAIVAYGDAAGHGYLRVVGDSIRTRYQNWINAYGMDSVVVDSVRVWGETGDGYFSDVSLVRVTRSSFADMYYYSSAIEAYAGSRSGSVVVDSVLVSGATNCGQCAYGVTAYGTPVSVNRFAGENLYYGIQVSDSGATVTNSRFTDVYEGIYTYSSASPRPRVVVSNVTMTGAYYGIETSNAVTVVGNVDLTAASGDYEGVYTYGGGADTVRSSRVTGYEYGVDLEDSVGYAASNTILRPTYDAIYMYGTGVPADTSVILNNVITCDAYGALNAGGMDAYSSSYVVQGNTVSGCNWSVYLETAPGLEAVVRGNTLTVPSEAQYPGVWIGGGPRAHIVSNTMTGGAVNADGGIYLLGGAYARVDSNTVRNPIHWAIRSLTTDSLYVRGNLIEDVTQACCTSDWAAIATSNSRYQLAMVGNTLRRVQGRGIWINQSRVGVDTAVVRVDSNAVSGADSAAVFVNLGDFLVMRGNNIRNNAKDGLSILTSFGYYQATGNAFQGNGRYALYSTADATVDATGNWWGVAGVAAVPGDPGADSVSGVIDYSSPLADEPSGLPALAPRLVASAPSATAVMLPLGSMLQPVVRGPRGPRIERPSRPPMVVKAPPTAAAADFGRRVQAIAGEKAQREAQSAAAREAVDQGRRMREAAKAERQSERRGKQ